MASSWSTTLVVVTLLLLLLLDSVTPSSSPSSSFCAHRSSRSSKTTTTTTTTTRRIVRQRRQKQRRQRILCLKGRSTSSNLRLLHDHETYTTSVTTTSTNPTTDEDNNNNNNNIFILSSTTSSTSSSSTSTTTDTDIDIETSTSIISSSSTIQRQQLQQQQQQDDNYHEQEEEQPPPIVFITDPKQQQQDDYENEQLFITDPRQHDDDSNNEQQEQEPPFLFIRDDNDNEQDQDKPFFTDPRYSNEEWSYLQINVLEAWSKGYFGNGIRVRINDNGVLSSHKEFDNRFDIDASCIDSYEPFLPSNTHGTAVAGIVGAAANNDQCSVGIAPLTIISSCIVVGINDPTEGYLSYRLDSIDISQNSYERPACLRRRRRRRRRRRKRNLVGVSSSSSSSSSWTEEEVDSRWRRRRLILWDNNEDDDDENDYYGELEEEEEEEDYYSRQQQQQQRNLEPSNGDWMCPFEIDDENTNPCEVCEEEFSSTAGSSRRNRRRRLQDSDTYTECESKIIQHCRKHHENDLKGCGEFYDLMLNKDRGSKCYYNNLSPYALDAITTGILEGRNGNGIIFVFASGNAYSKGDVTTIKGYTNSRYVISVGAVGKDGIHASYSTPGSSLFVVAPGGDHESRTNHVTSLSMTTTSCGTPGVGTSFSCPVVSGVIALILEANYDLGWRDIQGIIAKTSQRVVDEQRDTTAVTNGAGYWHSNLYGFGIINAGAAVTLAEQWQNYGEEKMILIESGLLNLPIDDNPQTTTESSIEINESDVDGNNNSNNTIDFIVESVAIFIDVQHLSRGDMDVILVSPSGTRSILHPGKRPEDTQLDINQRWKLLTVKNWGESPIGEWKLLLTDLKEGEISQGSCVDASWLIEYDEILLWCNRLGEPNNKCIDGAPSKTFFEGGRFADLLETQDEDNGMTMTDACCICGGGLYRDSFDDKLRQWSLVVYGHHVPRVEVTPDPTPSPTPGPTIGRTLRPTPGPSIQPTPEPTTSPTPGPTSSPTGGPTPGPTWEPTPGPTSSPTGGPTPGPTWEPTPGPTSSPTGGPTSQPTRPPTAEPTTTPSNVPTNTPTLSSNPTTQHSISPSNSINPSSQPSRFPSLSIRPSLQHSNAPSISIQPSTFPTYIPSISTSPSSSPTNRPSNHPTNSPSTVPTAFPTDYPSSWPSSFPSMSISPSISSNPTLTESNNPTSSLRPSSTSNAPTVDGSSSEDEDETLSKTDDARGGTSSSVLSAKDQSTSSSTSSSGTCSYSIFILTTVCLLFAVDVLT